jgi:hypothetical protein
MRSATTPRLNTVVPRLEVIVSNIQIDNCQVRCVTSSCFHLHLK